MKSWKICLSGLAIGCLTLTAVPAYADTVYPSSWANYSTSSATVDWGSMSMSSNISVQNDASKKTYSQATVNDFDGYNPFDDHFISGPGGWGDTSASAQFYYPDQYGFYHGANAIAGSTSASIYTNAGAASTMYWEDSSAFSQVERGAVFLVNGTGSVSFSLNYSLSAYAYDHYYESYTESSAMVWARLWVHNGSGWSELDNDLRLWYADPLGTIDVSALFDQGQWGWFEVGARSEAYAEGWTEVVPIPGSVFLFGSGLLGLIGLRRKREK